ncbi:F-box domain containing protein [Tanacetum coccineum]
MNVQCDRLSNLPDDLIHKILSLVGTKLAVQTSALSPRWRYLWTTLPCLNFSRENFKTLPKFFNFVTHVLSCCDNQIDISSAKLSFRGKASQEFVTKILNYAFSHNVKQLTISGLPDKSEIEFPLSLFSSQSLEHLTLTGFLNLSSVILTLTRELTSLTTLHLESITFNDEVTAKDTDICHPRLTNLTLVNGPFFKNVINVVAPQLKDLTVRNWEGLHLLSAPELVSLRFYGWQSEWLKFSSYEFCSLENVDLCILVDDLYDPNKRDAHTIFDLLHHRHSVKYITLNLENFQLLAPLTELISYQPSPFVKLKSLKVYPEVYYVKVLQTIPAEVKKYLLDGSPSATFTEVSYEEMRASKNAKSALSCMAELGEMLEHEKAIETNMDRVVTPMECHEQDKMQIGKREMRSQINSCWKDVSAQIEHGKAKTSAIISMLCDIEEFVTEPASKRAQFEAVIFYSHLLRSDDFIKYV